jgi:hypothetical protein
MSKAQVKLEAGKSGLGIEIEIDSVQFCASVRLDTDTDTDFDFDFDFEWSKPQLGRVALATRCQCCAATRGFF